MDDEDFDEMPFTTIDNDNDANIHNCASRDGGGWWFYNCAMACTTCGDGDAIWGTMPGNDVRLRAARMLIRLE